jgi:hypothetical protein
LKKRRFERESEKVVLGKQTSKALLENRSKSMRGKVTNDGLGKQRESGNAKKPEVPNEKSGFSL